MIPNLQSPLGIRQSVAEPPSPNHQSKIANLKSPMDEPPPAIANCQSPIANWLNHRPMPHA